MRPEQEQGQQHEMAGVEAASFVTKLCTALSDFDQVTLLAAAAAQAWPGTRADMMSCSKAESQ